MIGREALILVLVFAGFAALVAVYSAVFHGTVSVKEMLSNAFAATVGMYVGRYVERKLSNG